MTDKSKKRSLSDFYNIHSGKTIYLIGNGYGLLEIPDNIKNKLKNEITIGVNSSHLFGTTTYNNSSTWSCYLMNCHFGEVTECRFYQGRGMGLEENDSSWHTGGPTTLPETFYDDNNTVSISHHLRHPFFDSSALFVNPGENGPIFGADNSIFGATNIATIMGAKKIVYLGFDGKGNHYYDEPTLMEKYIQQKDVLIEIYADDPFIQLDLADMENKNITKKEALDYLTSTYGETHRKLHCIFTAMREKDVTPYVSKKDSVVYEAGATFLDWENYE